MGDLSEKLQLGMSLDEVKAILGEPTAGIGGAEYLDKMGKVSGSPSAIKSMGAKGFYLWKRPEGSYEVVFRDGRLLSCRFRGSEDTPR